MTRLPSNKELKVKPTKAQKRIAEKICSPAGTSYLTFEDADRVAKATQEGETEGWTYIAAPSIIVGRWVVQIFDSESLPVGIL